MGPRRHSVPVSVSSQNLTIARLFTDWSVPLEATNTTYQLHHRRFAKGLLLAGMPES